MSFIDAAYSVLREKREWMHVSDLVQEVLDLGLYVSAAEDPMLSLTGTLHSQITRGPNRLGFARHGSMFGLKEWGPKIPPPDSTGPSPRRRTSPSSFSTLPLTEEQILAIKATLPSDQFEELFGDIWQRYQEQRRRSLITNVSNQHLLSEVRREVDHIQDFLLGQSKLAPGPELITNWIVFCYQIGLYREGAALFKQIGPDQIGQALYEHVSKIAGACEVRLKG